MGLLTGRAGLKAAFGSYTTPSHMPSNWLLCLMNRLARFLRINDLRVVTVGFDIFCGGYKCGTEDYIAEIMRASSLPAS